MIWTTPLRCNKAFQSTFLLSQEEKGALSDVAREIQEKLLAEPDEHGYTPRSLTTDEQKEFMEALATGELFEQWV